MISDKIVSRSKLAQILRNSAYSRLKVVFTNGCFDILHAGHVTYLEKSREMGDILVVGLNSDSSVKKIKGPLRPLVPEEDRAVLLGALESVSFVTLFDEETPLKLIEELKPHILVKGKDYEDKEVVGQTVVENNGGKVELVELVEGRGTTNVIQEVLKRYQK